MLGTSIMARKERVLSIEGHRPDGSLDDVVVDLDPPLGQEKPQAIPVFGDVSQGLAERGLARDTGTVVGEPGLHVGDQWR